MFYFHMLSGFLFLGSEPRPNHAAKSLDHACRVSTLLTEGKPSESCTKFCGASAVNLLLFVAGQAIQFRIVESLQSQNWQPIGTMSLGSHVGQASSLPVWAASLPPKRSAGRDGALRSPLLRGPGHLRAMSLPKSGSSAGNSCKNWT